jgi:Prealbumin-like fold domain
MRCVVPTVAGDIPSPATHGSLSATSGSCADVSFASPPSATTSFTDPLALGAILITKTGKDKSCIGAGNPAGCSAASTRLLPGAGFQLKSGSSVKYTSGLTGAVGTICISGIVPGSYTLHESTVPSGFAAAADQSRPPHTGHVHVHGGHRPVAGERLRRGPRRRGPVTERRLDGE